jgi:hypothetical protein
MKIVTYQVKAELKRNADGYIESKIDMDSKTILPNKPPSICSSSEDIADIAMRIAGENGKQQEIARNTLFPSENEGIAFVSLKFLEV